MIMMIMMMRMMRMMRTMRMMGMTGMMNMMVMVMVKNLRLTLRESGLTGCGCSGGLREARQGVQNLGKSPMSLSMSSKTC